MLNALALFLNENIKYKLLKASQIKMFEIGFFPIALKLTVGNDRNETNY